MRRKLAALAIGGTALLGAGLPIAASASSQAPARAGTCTVHANYTNHPSLGTFVVIATSDSCSGGGSVKYQAENICNVGGTNDVYNYGSWLTSGSSTASGGGECDGQSGIQTSGDMRLNMNNPVRFTCWVSGDPNTGTCSGST